MRDGGWIKDGVGWGEDGRAGMRWVGWRWGEGEGSVG